MVMDRAQMLACFEKQKEETEKKIGEGIEKYRKGDARIRVVDKSGAPVRDAEIKIEQKTHAFRFGANLFMLEEFDTPEKNEAYKAAFAGLFNLATVPFYWSDLEPEQGKPRFAKDAPKVYRRPATDLCLDFCAEHGIEPKAHCLTYVNFTPDWVDLNDVEKTKVLLEERYRVLAEHCKDRIPSWEVINETLCFGNKNHFTNFFRMKDLVEWNFALAEKYFSHNELILNEASSFVWLNRSGDRANYHLLIERALSRGSRIDSIGMQYHLFNRPDDLLKIRDQVLNPAYLYGIMDSYAEFGKPLQITEITVPAYSPDPEDEEIQADIIEHLYSVWFSHPNMEAIIYWNLPDGYAAFGPKGDFANGENYYRGGLLRYDLSKKPAYDRLYDLIHHRWHTTLTLQASGGTASLRGFYGGYEATVTTDGASRTYPFDLKKGGENDFTFVIG